MHTNNTALKYHCMMFFCSCRLIWLGPKVQLCHYQESCVPKQETLPAPSCLGYQLSGGKGRSA